jgi:lambda repressor-like predicted transcriptional regulator
MNRRGFLGALSGAVFGGRRAVAEMAKGEAEKWALAEPTAPIDDRVFASSSVPFFSDPEKVKSRALASLGNLFTSSNKDKVRRAIVVTRLDADIASLRSFSLSVKMEMQRERVLARALEIEKSDLERIISDALEAVGGGR